MHQPDTEDTVASFPTLPAPGTPGWYTPGDPGSGVPASVIDPYLHNALIQELLNVLIAGGVTPDKATLDQVATAIQNMIDAIPQAAVTQHAAAVLAAVGVVATPAEINANDISAKVTCRDDFTAFFFDSTSGIIYSEQVWRSFTGANVTTNFIQSGLVNGIARCVYGVNAGASYAANGITLFTTGSFRADNGNLVFEGVIAVTAITDIAVFVGLASGSPGNMPFTLGSGDALTSNLVNAVGFLFDTAADIENIWLVGVADSVDATHEDTGQALVPNTPIRFRVEIDATGAADFIINGSSVGSQMSGAVDPSAGLHPDISGFSRSTSQKYLDLDYSYTQQDR